MTKTLGVSSVALLVAFSAFGQSQAGLASLGGVVQDSTGAAVPGAKVTVANESKGIKRVLESNGDGIFLAPSLAPSEGYQLVITNPGFNNYELKNIDLRVGQQANLVVTLSVQTATTQVDVSDSAPIVDSSKTDVSDVVSSAQILNLPINGRRVDSFVLLTPAVVPDGSFGLVSFRGSAGGNAFLTDGNDTTNSFYAENAGRTRIASQISQDAVQEFQVLTDSFSAEFGHASGGVVNTVTRSGGNDLHGTAYWFFRNRTLNAADRYAQGYNPPEYRHQAGGSLGGRLVKDKLFYFANVEITRRNFPALNKFTSSSLFNSSGAFIGACGAATPAQCAAARDFIAQQNNVLVPRQANSELLFGKLDWRPNDRNSITASLNYLRWLSPNGIQTQAVLTGGQAIGGNADSTVRTRYGRASWTGIVSSNAVNELRFGWFKDRLYDDFEPSLVPAQTGRVGITVAGTSNLGTATSSGYPRLNPSEQRFELADTYSWTLGKHSLKFGADATFTQDFLKILVFSFGQYTYGTFENFALDFSGNTSALKRWQSFQQGFGNPQLDMRRKDFAFFAQDQYRITPKLTLSLGIRYEYEPFKNPSLSNPDNRLTSKIPSDATDVAPRVGLAYSFGDQKTVIRAGYGIYYQRVTGGLLENFYFGNGIYQVQAFLSGSNAAQQALGPVFPSPLPASATLPGGSVNLQFAAPDFRTPYTQQGDVAVERQLTKTMGLTVSYLWSRGVRLFTARDLNLAPPTDSVTYRINDAAGNQTGSYATPVYRTRLDPRYGRFIEVDNGGNSYYDALAVQLHKNLSHGLIGSVAYTWSHAIDDANMGGGSDALFFSSVRSTFNGNYSADKGSSVLDQRHRLVVNSVWNPTFTKSQGFFAKYLVNNWQLSQITSLASPMRTTTTVLVQTAVPGLVSTSTLNGLGGSTRVPFLPFGNLAVDYIHRVDARISKVIPVTERSQLSLSFEAFNVFNTISNTGVYSTLYRATNGVLNPDPRPLGQGTDSQGFPDGTNARRMQASVRFAF